MVKSHFVPKRFRRQLWRATGTKAPTGTTYTRRYGTHYEPHLYRNTGAREDLTNVLTLYVSVLPVQDTRTLSWTTRSWKPVPSHRPSRLSSRPFCRGTLPETVSTLGYLLLGVEVLSHIHTHTAVTHGADCDLLWIIVT